MSIGAKRNVMGRGKRAAQQAEGVSTIGGGSNINSNIPMSPSSLMAMDGMSMSSSLPAGAMPISLPVATLLPSLGDASGKVHISANFERKFFDQVSFFCCR
jgi:hypothetical protein